MKNYEALPTLPSQHQLARAVAELLAEANAGPPLSKLHVAEALVDLVGRGPGSYVPFPPETKASIERWAAECWSSTNAELADALATLLVNTDSGLSRRVLTEACASCDHAVRLIAEEALRELGEP